MPVDWRKRAEDANQYALGMEAAAEEQRQRAEAAEREAEIDKERRAKLWATAKHWQERAGAAERERDELRADRDRLETILDDMIGELADATGQTRAEIETAFFDIDYPDAPLTLAAIVDVDGVL